MGKKWVFFGISTALIIIGIISIAVNGLRLGIDFIGGTLLEYQFTQPVDRDQIRQEIAGQGIEISSIVESSGFDGDAENIYIIKTTHIDQKQIEQVDTLLQEKYGEVNQLRIESVGPVIGGETTQNAFIALLLASVMIVLYIALAFRKVPKPTSGWRFGITAIAAVLHDVLVVVGSFSLLGYFFGVEVDVLFVTALLTIIGFSVHDTIVVFDRIRENLPKHLSKNFSDVANISIVQTIARSLNTSLTVLFVLTALLLFGGESMRWFVVALMIGIVVGTYSSIFNAAALLALWEEKLGH